MEVEGKGGGGGKEMLNSPSRLLEAGQVWAFRRLVNDAVLPSGRFLKAACHKSCSPSERTCQRRH